MMPQYDNRNTGVLFKNDKKTEDKHPDYKGSYTDASGKEHWVAAWIRTKKNSNEKFMSFKMDPKDAQAKAGEESQEPEGAPF